MEQLEKNIVSSQPDNIASETKPDTRSTDGFQREEFTGEIQRERNKENIRYVGPDGQQFFAKYTNQHHQNNIARLKKEKQILDRLVDTGVTPRAGEFKIYPNEKRARLLIEQVPGTSLDRMDDKQNEQFLKIKAEETIFATADALDKIHKKVSGSLMSMRGHFSLASAMTQ